MRCISGIFRLSLICITAACCCVYGNEKSKKNKKYETLRDSMKLTVKTASPPMLRSSGVVSGGRGKNSWVEVDLRFRTDNVRSGARRFLEDPELYVQLVTHVEVKNPKTRRTALKCIVFSGTVKYHAIEQDGDTHYMKVLLPGILYRKYAYDLEADKAIFLAKAELRCDGETIGTAYVSTKSADEKDIIKFFRKLPGKRVDAAGTLCGRYGTPWSIADVNKYEQEKTPWLNVGNSSKTSPKEVEVEEKETEDPAQKKKSKKK